MPTRRPSPNFRPQLVTLEARDVPTTVGGLDPSFDLDGKLAINLAAGANQANAMLVQPDGKILLVGTTDAGNSANADFLITRHLPSGALDTTFGPGGRVVIGFGPSKDDQATGVALQSTGDIIVSGWSNKNGGYDFAAIRLTSAGGFDPSFGNGGFVLIDIENADKASALGITADDRIVLAGGSDIGTENDIALVRLTADGNADSTFNKGEAKAFPLGANEQVNDLGILADNTIVLAGYLTSGSATDTIALRVAADGSNTDTNFANTQTDDENAYRFLKLDLGGEDKANALSIRPNNTVLLGGYATPTGTNRDWAVARVSLIDGKYDTTFGNKTGKVVFDLGGTSEQITGMAVQPDGRIVLGGFSSGGGAMTFAAARLTSTGAFDPSFNTDGKVSVHIGGNDQAFALTQDAQGRVLLAGKSNGNLAVARLAGRIDAPTPLLAGGSQNGQAQLFTVPAGAVQYNTNSTAVPFFTGFDKNVRVAMGDINGDGIPDRIAVAGPGARPVLTVRDGATDKLLVAPFDVFEPSFTGGLYVAAGDLNNDGRADIVVTPDQGGGPVVAVYSGALFASGLTGQSAQLSRFFGIDDSNFRGGARAAVGDVNADGINDLLVSAGFGGGPRVVVYDGRTVLTPVPAGQVLPRLVSDFFAFEDTLRNGAFVSLGDLDGDGYADLFFGGGPGGGPRVRVISGKTILATPGLVSLDDVPPAGFQLANFFAGKDTSRGGVPMTVRDMDGDNLADLVTASGQGEAARVLVYRGSTILTNALPDADQVLDLFGNGVLANGVYVG